jgi:hypothetical protein
MRGVASLVLAAACGGHVSAPTLLASGHTMENGLALDADNVYWIDFDPTSTAFAVMSVPKNGGLATSLYSTTATPTGFGGFQIVVANGHVVFTLEQHTLTNSDAASIMTVPVGGGAPTTLVATPAGQNSTILALAADDAAVYWIDDSSSGALRAVALDGGPTTTLATGLMLTAGGLPNNNQLVPDTSSLYLPSTSSTSTAIVALPKAGGATTLLATTSNCCPRLSVVGSTLYFTQDVNGVAELSALSLGSSAAQTIATWTPGPSIDDAYGLTADTTAVYFAAAPALWRVPASGGAPELLASTHDGNGAVAVDENYLFYADRGINKLSLH